MKYSAKQLVVASILAGLSAHVMAADPIQVAPRVIDKVKPRVPAGALQSIKPDLTVTGAGPDGEFCLDGCQAYVRDLGYQHNRCGWSLWVKNQGNGRSGATYVRLSLYVPRKTSPITSTVPLPALNAGEAKFLRIPNPNAGGHNVGYYDTRRDVTFEVDHANAVNESNETNNKLAIRP